MKNLLLITVFALIISGANSQELLISVNDNTSIQETETGTVQVTMETTASKAIDLLVKSIKARKDNTLTVTGQTPIVYNIVYDDSIYLVLLDEKELLMTTRITEVREYFKELLTE